MPLSSFSIVSIRHVRLQKTGGFSFRRIVFKQASGTLGCRVSSLRRFCTNGSIPKETHIRGDPCGWLPTRQTWFIGPLKESKGSGTDWNVVSLRSTSGIT